MGLFAYTVAGGGAILIGVWESVASASESITENPIHSSPQSAENVNRTRLGVTLFSSTTVFILISVLSLLFVVNSMISLSDAVSIKDNTGFALQLQVITIASLFLLISVLGILSNIASFHFPKSILNLIYAFAFGEEFFLFYTHLKDPSGVENRYYNLILVPIAVCLFSTLLEMNNQISIYARLGRCIGFISQGMWILQMGFSFFSNLIADGCSLNERSRGNFTIKCKGHPEYHRGSAIATLQFNCHLAVLVTLAVGFYSLFCKLHGINRVTVKYKPIGDGNQDQFAAQFTLESDKEEGIKETRNVEMARVSNGYGSP